MLISRNCLTITCQESVRILYDGGNNKFSLKPPHCTVINGISQI